MKDLGTVQSTVKPKNVDVRESLVFVASDIKEVTVTAPESEESHTEYEYSLKQYDKNEYIQLLQEQNDSLSQQITDAQVALCDIYEQIGG